jgi:hypothetical protein
MMTSARRSTAAVTEGSPSRHFFLQGAGDLLHWAVYGYLQGDSPGARYSARAGIYDFVMLLPRKSLVAIFIG